MPEPARDTVTVRKKGGLSFLCARVIFAVKRETVSGLRYVVSFCLLFWLACCDKLLYSVLLPDVLDAFDLF